MKNIFKVILVSFLTIMMSCSDDENMGGSGSNQVLQGKVFDLDFTALGGKAFDSGEKVSVNITNIAANCNSSVLDYKLSISVDVKPEVGVYENTNVVFDKEGEVPLNFLAGVVEVTSLTDSQITVKINANSSTDNKVEGRFTVSYCK